MLDDTWIPNIALFYHKYPETRQGMRFIYIAMPIGQWSSVSNHQEHLQALLNTELQQGEVTEQRRHGNPRAPTPSL